MSVADRTTRPQILGTPVVTARPKAPVAIAVQFAVAAFCACHPIPAFAAGASDGGSLALVEEARRAHDVRAGDSGPLTLVAHATLYHLVGDDRKLDYALVTYGPGHWFERVAAGGHIELRGLAQGTRWRRRPASKKSYRLLEAEMLLDPAAHLRLAPVATVRKTWAEQIGGVGAECLEVGPRDSYWQHDVSDTAEMSEVAYDVDRTVRLCFDTSTRALLLADYGANFPRFEYSGFVALGDKQFPRSMRCFEQKKLVVEAEVTSLAPGEAADPAAASVPEGVESWPACARPTPPRLVKKKPVEHYAQAKARRQFGQIVCHGEVSTGGNLHDLEYVDDRGQAYLVAAVNLAVGDWLYEPATCEGKPVPFELFLTFQFPPR